MSSHLSQVIEEKIIMDKQLEVVEAVKTIMDTDEEGIRGTARRQGKQET